MSAAELVTVAVVATGTGIACAHDVAHRRIPNAVSFTLAGAGFVLAVAGITGIGPWASIGGAFLGLLLMMPGHLFGALGAGDVKLLAAAGAVLGPRQTFEAFVFTAIAGGVLAVAFAWQRGRLGRTVRQTARLCTAPGAARLEIEAPGEHNRFPYAPAIAAGVVLAALR